MLEAITILYEELVPCAVQKLSYEKLEYLDEFERQLRTFRRVRPGNRDVTSLPFISTHPLQFTLLEA